MSYLAICAIIIWPHCQGHKNGDSVVTNVRTSAVHCFLLACRVSLLTGMSHSDSFLDGLFNLQEFELSFFSCQVLCHLQGVRSDFNFPLGPSVLCVCFKIVSFQCDKASMKLAFTHWAEDVATRLKPRNAKGRVNVHTHTHTHTLMI